LKRALLNEISDTANAEPFEGVFANHENVALLLKVGYADFRRCAYASEATDRESPVQSHYFNKVQGSTPSRNRKALRILKLLWLLADNHNLLTDAALRRNSSESE